MADNYNNGSKFRKRNKFVNFNIYLYTIPKMVLEHVIASV